VLPDPAVVPPTPGDRPPAPGDRPPSAERAGFWASVREALRGSEQDFTTGNLNRAVGLLAVPMVLEMAGESVFAVVDALFVGRLGAEALAAVGLTEVVLEIIYAVAIGLSMSTTAMVARRIGEKNDRAAALTAVQAIAVGIGFSIVFGVAGFIWAPDLLRIMGASPETIETGTTYTRIMYGTMVVILRWRCAPCGSPTRSTSSWTPASYSGSGRSRNWASRAQPSPPRSDGAPACCISSITCPAVDVFRCVERMYGSMEA
jgi:hypothetical protein